MAGVKLIVMYPKPKDAAEFERVYFAEHIPMVQPVLEKNGATRVVLTKMTPSPMGEPAFYRSAEIHFPSMNELLGFAGSKEGQAGVAHAGQISTGGAPTVMIAEEEVVTL